MASFLLRFASCWLPDAFWCMMWVAEAWWKVTVLIKMVDFDVRSSVVAAGNFCSLHWITTAVGTEAPVQKPMKKEEEELTQHWNHHQRKQVGGDGGGGEVGPGECF